MALLAERKKIENATITYHFRFEFEQNRTIIVMSSFSKCFPSRLKLKASFSNSSGLKSVFEKFRFRDE